MTTDPDSFLTALRLSDSFLPVGGYTASYGLEQYINEGRIEDGEDLRALIAGYLRRVVGPCETVALANAHAASAAGDLERLLAVDERLHAVTMPREFRESSTKAGAKLCELLGPEGAVSGTAAAGRDREGSCEVQCNPTVSAADGGGTSWSTETGRFSSTRRSDDGDITAAFADAMEDDSTPGHYPVVFGIVAAERNLSRLDACLAHAYSFVTGLLGAAQRLGRFSHTEIQSVLEDLRPVISAVCERHVDDSITAMTSFAPLAEIMGMRHECAGRRLFMS